MKTVCEFLQKAHVFYVATVEGDQPRVRPFGIAHIIDGNMQVLYFEDATATFDSFAGEHRVVRF